MIVSVELARVRERLQQVAKLHTPSICKRPPPGQFEQQQQDVGIRVIDWSQVKKHRSYYGLSGRALLPSTVISRVTSKANNAADATLVPRPSMPKLSKAVKTKSNTAGRTYTSRFRGVHQTFPTRRWEAQFR